MTDRKGEYSKEIADALDNVEKKLNDQRELSWFNLHHRRFIETLQILKVALPPSAYVLDIGCYPGHLTMAIKCLGYKVSGVDMAPDRFKERMNTERINIKECNLEEDNLPFANETFDCVLLTEVIEHLAHHRLHHVFSEIRRVLKMGKGILILSTPNIATLDNRILLLFGKEILIKEHNREYTMREVEALLKEAGFKILEQRYSLARDVVTHAIPEKFISREHVFSGFLKHPYWKNIGRALTLPLKKIKPALRSIIFIVAEIENSEVNAD